MANQEVAKIILQQLGGHKFMTMTGAKNFISTEDSLSFKIPKSLKNINHVRITLAPNDTYTMDFLAIRGLNPKVVGRFENVHFDLLHDIFTSATGLYTHL